MHRRGTPRRHKLHTTSNQCPNTIFQKASTYQFGELQLNHYKASDFEGDVKVQAIANGSKDNDTLIAKDDSNWLITDFYGDDLLIGRNGDDHLFGGEG